MRNTTGMEIPASAYVCSHSFELGSSWVQHRKGRGLRLVAKGLISPMGWGGIMLLSLEVSGCLWEMSGS